jgi:hypothetical protein
MRDCIDGHPPDSISKGLTTDPARERVGSWAPPEEGCSVSAALISYPVNNLVG